MASDEHHIALVEKSGFNVASKLRILLAAKLLRQRSQMHR